MADRVLFRHAATSLWHHARSVADDAWSYVCFCFSCREIEIGSVANSERAGITACVLGGSYAAMPKIVWMNWRCATASPLATQRT